MGEVFNSIWDCKQLIEEQLIDYIRTTLTHAGGITGMRRIADFASLYQVRTGTRSFRFVTSLHARCTLICGSPISVSVNTWVIPNKCSKSSRTTGLSITAICIREKPGLGIEFDEKLAAKYPYEPAYLPVARLEDGTLWNW